MMGFVVVGIILLLLFLVRPFLVIIHELGPTKTAYKHFQKAANLESGIPLLDNLLNQTKPQQLLAF